MLSNIKNAKPSSQYSGICCMIFGALALTINDGMAKYLTQTYPVGQVMALRGACILMLLTIFLIVNRKRYVLKINSWGSHISRAAAMTGSTFCFITGLSYLPIADAISIAFVAPILTIILAIFFLNEKVGWHRWVAIVFGFFGVLIIVQPTGEGSKLAALGPLGAALFGAIRDLITRKMSATESSMTILLTSMILVTFAGFLTWPFGWMPLKINHLLIFAISSILVGLAQYLMIEAFRLGEIGLISPFKYSSLLWATLIGFLIWNDTPNHFVLIGSSVLILSGVYLLRGESKQQSREK